MVIFVALRDVLNLFSVFGGRKHQLYDFIQFRKLARNQDFVDSTKGIWVINGLLKEHQADKGVYTDQAHFPCMAGTPDLRLKITRVRSTYND